MSLDLAGKSGVVTTTAAIATAAGLVAGAFAATAAAAAKTYITHVDTTAGAVDLSEIPAPNSMAFVEDGDTFTFIKTTSDANAMALNFTTGTNLDSSVGVTLGYANRLGESYTVVANLATNKWMYAA